MDLIIMFWQHWKAFKFLIYIVLFDCLLAIIDIVLLDMIWSKSVITIWFKIGSYLLTISISNVYCNPYQTSIIGLFTSYHSIWMKLVVLVAAQLLNVTVVVAQNICCHNYECYWCCGISAVDTDSTGIGVVVVDVAAAEKAQHRHTSIITKCWMMHIDDEL